MVEREQIERLIVELATNPGAAMVVREPDGSWTLHDQRTGWAHASNWEQAARLRIAGAIVVDG
jgi:hypothetical protein